MDTLTHGLAGALLARALPSTGDSRLDRALARREVWVGFGAAMFPDADALLAPFSPAFYITQHRGLTHSFWLLPLWALLLGTISAWRLPVRHTGEAKRAWLRLVAVSGLGVLSHILLDWVTSWGTMFFSPFSWRRFALDWVFIIDFVLSGLLVLGLLGTRFATRRRGDPRGRAAARASLVLATAYVLFCGTRHASAMAVGERVLPPGAPTRAAIPQPLSPDRWLLLADDGTGVTASFVDLSRRGREEGVAFSSEALERLGPSETGVLLGRLGRLYRSPDDPAPRRIPRSDGALAARTLEEGTAGVFGRFARFPAAREVRDGGGRTRVVLRDVRFGYLSSAIDPFTYVVSYDAQGRLESAGFPSERWAKNGVARAPGPGRAPGVRPVP